MKKYLSLLLLIASFSVFAEVYVVYDISTGAKIGETSDTKNLPNQQQIDANGWAVKTFADDEVCCVWNAATLSFDPVNNSARIATISEFIVLLSDIERKNLLSLTKTNADIELFWELLKINGDIRVDSTFKNYLDIMQLNDVFVGDNSASLIFDVLE